MKRNYPFLLIAMILVSQAAMADAGFSIRRQRPATQLTFEGTGKLTDHTLMRSYTNQRDPISDADKFIIQDGGKYWDESERNLRFVLVNANGRVVDSFTVFMKKHNYHMVITGVRKNKLQYKMKKSKAYFNYTVIEGDDSGNGTVNRWIFIACSMLGFVLLVLMFLKRRKLKLV